MLSIILPTYNEKENIKIIINLILKNLKKEDFEIIIVDDNSPDKTGDIVLKNFKKNKNVRLLIRKNQKGLSSAVVDGIKHSKGDLVAVMDADLSHPPELLKKMISTFKKNQLDMVIGSRIVKGGSVESWPIQRKIMSFGARLLCMPLTRLKDTMSGFFMFRKDILKGIKLKPKGYKILLEILIKSKIKRYKEIPYTFKNRELGESKIDDKVIIDYVIHLADLYWYSFKHKLI